MTVKDVTKDLDAKTMTVVAEFDAPVDRVWQVWADPRQLERWWGPPTYPATFTEYDLRPGGLAAYYMTGPEGDRPHGWWRFVAVDAPRRLEFEDGFADDEGRPKDDMPTMTIVVNLSETNERTQVEIVTTFPSKETMEQVLEMGIEEGMLAAIGQIDELLAS